MPRLSSEGIDALARELEQEPLRAALLTPKMLLAGAEVVRQGWKKAAEENKFRRTGGLIAAINYARSVKKLADAKYVEIYPQGKNSKGTRYSAIAYILHFGTMGSQALSNSASARAARLARKRLREKKYPGRPGIPATLWVNRAEELSANAAVEEMRRIWSDG